MATIANAAKWLENNDISHIKVMKGKSIVFKYPINEDKNVAAKDAIEFFEENIKHTEAGHYTLLGRHNKAWGPGDFTFAFSHTLNGQTGAAISGIGEDKVGEIVNARIGQVNAQWEAKFKDLEHKREIEDLQKQLKEAKAGNSEWGLDKIHAILQDALKLGQVMKSNPAAISALPTQHSVPAPQPAPAATPPADQSAGDETARFGKAITTLTSITGGDTVEAFEALATFAQQNPGQFNLYLAQLKSSQQ